MALAFYQCANALPNEALARCQCHRVEWLSTDTSVRAFLRLDRRRLFHFQIELRRQVHVVGHEHDVAGDPNVRSRLDRLTSLAIKEDNAVGLQRI